MDKQTVYERIKEQIIEENYPPGSWFIERELCTTYSMSRTPIREVLWKLVADGLLEQEANRGFVVRKLGLEQIFEVFQAREAIEGMAARLACSKGGESFHATLREIHEALDTLDAEKYPAQGSTVGRRLHGVILEAAHNQIMFEIYEKLKNLSILTSNITRKSPAIEKNSREAHLILIDALLEKNEDKSEWLMRKHLRDTCRQIIEQFYPNMLSDALNNKNGFIR